MDDLLGPARPGRRRLYGSELEGGFGAVAATGAGYLRNPALAPSRPSRGQ